MSALRRLWRLPLVSGWVLFGLLLAALLHACPRRWRDRLREQLTVNWMRGLLRLLPLRIHGHGQPLQQPALWGGNHVSWLDIIVLGASAPLRFVAKSEVRQWPLLGWLAHSAGTLFIRRGDAGGLQTQMAAALDQGQSLMIFAEGTTTLGHQVRTFHGRLLSCAVERQLPLQPIALRYHHQGQLARQAAFIDDDEFSSHLWRLLGSSPVELELHFLPPISSRGLGRNQLARQARQAVVQALGMEDESISCQCSASCSAAA